MLVVFSFLFLSVFHCIDMPYFFFIYSPPDGIWVISTFMNNTFMNICIQDTHF